MKKLILLFGVLIFIGSLQAHAGKSRVAMKIYQTGNVNGSTTVRRSPMRIPIYLFYDDELRQIEISGIEDMKAEVFLYDSTGNLENYSSSLNTVFTVLTSGTYIIEIQGDGWYAEGEIEVE